ncbi:MAG: isoprenylcysteine carboxylmethyltransferase family protein [Deltaproteobacteria bacterium]|nr:isoprenylcysteine carboxylmethyltransferase family protein [Deltaproteobacteria bacterium]
MEYFLLCALWILWCFLHSFLVATKTTTKFKKQLGEKFAFYRIFYNLFSIITVLPLLYWQSTIPGPIIIALSPFLVICKYILLASGVIVIAGSFASIDIREFIGIRQKVYGDQQKEKETVISKRGLYGIVRHPMYFGGIIFFAASMTGAPLPQFLGYLILAIYMIIGTVREDRRLSRELGAVYRNYQKEVPMILPMIPGRKN